LEIQSLLAALAGAKTLIDRFINLGMPLALESDDFLRAMLYGRQPLKVTKARNIRTTPPLRRSGSLLRPPRKALMMSKTKHGKSSWPRTNKAAKLSINKALYRAFMGTGSNPPRRFLKGRR